MRPNTVAFLAKTISFATAAASSAAIGAAGIARLALGGAAYAVFVGFAVAVVVFLVTDLCLRPDLACAGGPLPSRARLGSRLTRTHTLRARRACVAVLSFAVGAGATVVNLAVAILVQVAVADFCFGCFWNAVWDLSSCALRGDHLAFACAAGDVSQVFIHQAVAIVVDVVADFTLGRDFVHARLPFIVDAVPLARFAGAHIFGGLGSGVAFKNVVLIAVGSQGCVVPPYFGIGAPSQGCALEQSDRVCRDSRRGGRRTTSDTQHDLVPFTLKWSKALALSTPSCGTCWDRCRIAVVFRRQSVVAWRGSARLPRRFLWQPPGHAPAVS